LRFAAHVGQRNGQARTPGRRTSNAGQSAQVRSVTGCLVYR